MITRRTFLRSILPAAAGVIVAPTLAETLLVSTKKYFFLSGNPLVKRGPFHEWSLGIYDKLQADIMGLHYWACSPETGTWLGFSRNGIYRIEPDAGWLTQQGA